MTYAAGSLTGKPTKRTDGTTNSVEHTVTYTATDTGATPNEEVSTTFKVTVYAAIDVPDVSDQTFTVGGAVSVTFDEATGGYPPLTYALQESGALPLTVDGLSFVGGTRTLSGTPTTATSGALAVFYVATDAYFNTSSSSFTITINAAPTLADVADQTYTAGTAISTLQLPKAANGTAPFTYELEGPSGGALPAGLEFDGTTDPPQLTGTPTTAAAAVTLTYTATDANGAEVEKEFDVTVEAGDSTAPTVASIERVTPSGEDTNADSLTFRVTFSEDVENVGTDDFTVTEPGGGTATTATVTGVQARTAADDADATEPASVFRVTVSSGNLDDYDGTVGLGFATNQDITDEADNDLTATLPAGTNYETYTLDNMAPTPALSVAPAKHDGGSASEVTVDFGEAVTGFVEGDVTVTGGTTSDFTGSDGDSSYTVTVTPTGNANVTVTVAAGVAADRAGNASLVAADSVTVEYAAPQAFSWQATLVAGESTGYHGYCGGSCPITGVGGHGTLDDDGNDASFTLPGPGFEVEVTALSRVGHRLHVGLETAASVYGTWTLDWEGVKQVTLSSRSRVGIGGDLEFDNFFADIDNIDEGETVELCIIGHGGVSACTRDATLSALGLTDPGGTAVALDQTFAAGTTAYTASVGNDVETGHGGGDGDRQRRRHGGVRSCGRGRHDHGPPGLACRGRRHRDHRDGDQRHRHPGLHRHRDPRGGPARERTLVGDADGWDWYGRFR